MPETDPAEVLKMIDLELARARTVRRSDFGNRNAFRVWSLVMILAATAGAFFLLQFMVAQLPRPEHATDASQACAASEIDSQKLKKP